MWTLLAALLLCWIAVSALMITLYRKPLLALWREPLLRDPVLIIESDDWGAGPTEQATALSALQSTLDHYQDRHGQPPVMTLGIILAVADTAAIKASLDANGKPTQYQRISLSDPALSEVRKAIMAVHDAGIFALQLHGMEHYRPASLMQAAHNDKQVADWLTGPPLPTTEPLPSPLQSRWTDSSQLPSTALPSAEIDALVAEETSRFNNTFGQPARVVVPPTFQWTVEVEQAWSDAGIRTLVSPGSRQTRREADGTLSSDGSQQHNGGQGHGQIHYLIRDAWFEPAMGHSAAKGLQALQTRSQLKRPTLLETHRFNFLGEQRKASLNELDQLLRGALQQHPDLRFCSSEQLSDRLRSRDPAWIEPRFSSRCATFLQRLRPIPRIGKLARLGAFGLPLSIAQLAFRPNQTNQDQQ